ncbi:MAG: hypothetical protein WD688_01645 [Candidatus Binatia bacterium]
MTHKAGEAKGKKPMRNSKGSEEHPKKVVETTRKDTGTEKNDVVVGSGDMKGNVPPPAATQINSPKTLSPESVETTDVRESLGSDQKQKDALEGFIAWDEE